MARTKRQRLAALAESLPALDVTEDQYQAWICERATEAGWALQFHVERAQVKGGRWVTNTSTPGVPDLWLLRPTTGQLVVLEVKRQRDQTSAERRAQQAAWVSGLQRVPGVEAYVVRPSDARDVLDLLARPRPHPTKPERATVPAISDQGSTLT